MTAIRYVLLLISLCWLITAQAAQPQISQAKAGPQGAVIQGSGFGKACGKCEVIADFGRGFKYAFPVASWQDKKIVAAIADIGKGNKVKLSVRAAGGESKAVNFNIPSQKVPARRVGKLTRGGGELLVFEHKSNLSVGDKGEQSYDVSSAPPACGQVGMVYDSADIVLGKSRFGEAKIVATPKVGCSKCRPIKVRWYHEPTGKLHYQVHVYRRAVQGICNDKVRR